MTIPDLWPEEFDSYPLTPPVAILRRQAELLTEKTGGLLETEINTNLSRRGLVHDFVIIASALGNYRHKLLAVHHRIIEVYPVEIVITNDVCQCDTPERLINDLGFILRSEKTRKVISSLIAQCRM